MRQKLDLLLTSKAFFILCVNVHWVTIFSLVHIQTMKITYGTR